MANGEQISLELKITVRTPLFPSYEEVSKLIQIWDGVPRETVLGMIYSVHEQTGTPQNPVDWTEPDKWIGERLEGKHRDLANRIWKESGGTANPRHIYGSRPLRNELEAACTALLTLVRVHLAVFPTIFPFPAPSIRGFPAFPGLRAQYGL